jgi:acyl carrier protein
MNESMTIEELISNISGQLNRHDPSKLSADTILRDIEGFSSLEALFILLMIDDVYKVNITGDDMMEISTIGDLYNLIKSRK